MDIISPSTLSNGVKVFSNTHVTVAAVDTITIAGARKINRVIASFETDSADANYLVSAKPGTVDGTIVISSWRTDGTDPTPVAATAFTKRVAYIAVGY